MPYCLSIDLGTSRVKAGVYDEKCSLLASAGKEAPMDISKGYCIQQAQDFLRVLKLTLKELPFDLKSIDVISFSGQMAGAVGVDKNCSPVTVWSGTVDTRSGAIPIQDKEKVLRVCGSISPFMAQKIIMLEKEARAAKYISLLGYVIGKMTGLTVDELAVQETNLSWTGLADLKTRTWSSELISMFGINPDLLPRIAGATEIAGKITSEAAAEFGLPPGVSVLAGVGDKIAGCIGTGAIHEGDIVDESASVPAITINTRGFNPDLAHGTWDILPSINAGSYYAMHYIPGAGIALDWFINTFAQEEKRTGKEKHVSAYDVLEEKASAVPAGSDSLLCVSLLGGRTLPYQPNISGVFIGHKMSHTKAHFYRAFLESFAYEYKRCMDVFSTLYPGVTIGDVRSIGGGSRSALLSQIKSEVLGRTYLQMDRDDGTLLGCAIIGFTGIGVFSGEDEFAVSKPKKRYVPDEKNRKTYERMVHLYNRVINNNDEIFNELSRSGNET
ncbi:MAG: hypothetical protein LBH35_09455 [Treponema sp.]|jgi:xylulokinase|nr:hypothetical protein [Treponema sp.]